MASSCNNVGDLPSEDDVLRIICTFGAITGIPAGHFKFYERHDGTPILPGVDFDHPTADGIKRWKNRFVKSAWKNSNTSVSRRRLYPITDKSKHANSLPLDFSIYDYVKPRRALRRSGAKYPQLPDWTLQHYHSQFLQGSKMQIGADVLKRLLCNAHIGGVELMNAETTIDGNQVKWHLQAFLDSGGHCYFDVDGVSFQMSRIPRARVVDGRALDTVGISVINGDTSRPFTHIMYPPELSTDKKKIFVKVTKSSDLQVKYAEERAAGLGDDSMDSKVLAEESFLAKLQTCLDSEISFCIEIAGVSFASAILQDSELLKHFPHGLSSKRRDVEGYIEHDHGMESPFALQGFEMEIAIEGRSDMLHKEETREDFIQKAFEKMTISGAFEL